MRQELVRFLSTDKLELSGILYKPENDSSKTIIHVHGLAGNFYGNSYTDYLAEAYTKKGYNFLVFNNRGTSYYSEFNKFGDISKRVFIGSVYEKFTDSVNDIEGAINFVKSIGTEEIILEGHSYGCNKVIYYYNQKKDNNISKIILLAPCDVILSMKYIVGEKFDMVIEHAKKLVSEGKGKELLESEYYPKTYTAETFVDGFIPDSQADIFRYREPEYISPPLKDIKIPVLIQIGTNDEYIKGLPRELIINFFESNLDNYKLDFIEGATHNYSPKEKELVKNLTLNI